MVEPVRWRVLNFFSVENFCSVREDIKPEYVKMVTRIPQLLKRLVRGEEKNLLLFLTVRDGFMFLKERVLTSQEFKNFEAALVMKILHALGYWGEHKELSPFLKDALPLEHLLPRVEKRRPFVIREINKALKETQL